MARGNDNAPHPADSTKAGDRVATYTANTTDSEAKAGERVAAYAANAGQSAAEAGERLADETTKAGERAGASAAAAGERIAADMADRIGDASRAYGPALEAAFTAARDYNAKLIQIIQMNAEANLRLGRSLMHTRTPTDFADTIGRSVRERTELIAWQAKELAALGQEATRRTIEAFSPRR